MSLKIHLQIGAPFDVSFAKPLALKDSTSLACVVFEFISITQSTSSVGRISEEAGSLA
jgi:hypothetical protein